MSCLRSHLVDGSLPEDRIGREGLSYQPGLPLEALADVALEITPEGPLGYPKQDRYCQNEDEYRSEHQPLDKGHRLLAPRSLPLKR